MSSFTAGFIGLGLIGGSIVRAMKYYYPDCRILAFNRSRSTLDYALEEGIIDEALPSINEAFASCDYIFLCDQDDVWLPEKRQSVVSAFRSGGADLILHDAVHTDDTLNRQNKTFFELYPLGPGKWKNIKKPRMSGCCMAFTRAMRDKVLPLPEIYGYDQWIFVVAEFVGRIEYLPQVLLLHRLHGENSTSSTRRLDVVLYCRAKLLIHLGLRLLRIKFLKK